MADDNSNNPSDSDNGDGQEAKHARDPRNRKNPSDPCPARRVADAVEAAIAITACTVEMFARRDPRFDVRLGAGISSGPPTVVGFLGGESSAH